MMPDNKPCTTVVMHSCFRTMVVGDIRFRRRLMTTNLAANTFSNKLRVNRTGLRETRARLPLRGCAVIYRPKFPEPK
jgi:hypothetical protein